MVSSRQRRAARGVVAASVATLFALMSHLLGGGELPGVLGIAIPWVLSMPVCVILAGRELSLWRLSISIAFSQVLFHGLFVLGTPATGAALVSVNAGHGAHGAPVILSAVDPSAHTAAMHAHAPMWVWHSIAAALTIAALYWGEQALVRLRELAAETVRWVRRRFVIGSAAAPRWPALYRVSPGQSTAALSEDVQLMPLQRRGPPLPSVL